MIYVQFIIFKQPLDVEIINGEKDTYVNQDEEDNENGKKKKITKFF